MITLKICINLLAQVKKNSTLKLIINIKKRKLYQTCMLHNSFYNNSSEKMMLPKEFLRKMNYSRNNIFSLASY